LRVAFDQFNELIAVLGFHLELDDDHDAAHRHFLRHDSAASSAIGWCLGKHRPRIGEV
jgi:hypothetical protein